jgi:hypothetical protein
MIVLLMLTQRSWMLFWALAEANVDEDDDIHLEDCDEGDDYSINDEEEENSD